MLNDAGALRSLVTYGETPISSNTGGVGMNAQKTGHWPVIVALAALNGVTTPFGGKTAAERLREQLEHWADDRMPNAVAGYRSQYEAHFVATVAIAKLTPVWGQLSAERRDALTLGMKACLVGSAWVHSTTHPFGAGFSSNRCIRGRKAGQTSNTNYVIGGKLMPFVVAGFLDGGPAEADSFLTDFSRSAFRAQLAATGRNVAAANTVSKNWTQEVWSAEPYVVSSGAYPSDLAGPGPTATQLEAALDNWRIQVAPGSGARELSIHQRGEAFVDAVLYNFRHPIRVGLEGEGVDPYGIWDNTRTPPQIRARIADQGAWSALPNQGLLGMAQELDASDAQGPRSAMSYSQLGYTAHMSLSLALVAQGVVLAGYDQVDEMVGRTRRATIDLRYRTQHGYLSYAKGGKYPPHLSGGSNTNNEDWPTAEDYAFAAGYGLGDLVVSAYGMDPNALD